MRGALREVRTSGCGVSHAFHSPLMEPMLAEFAQVAEALTYAPPRIPVVSNLTGHWPTRDAGRRLLGAARAGGGPVRRRHRHPASGLGVSTFLEIGPRRASSTAMGADCCQRRGVRTRGGAATATRPRPPLLTALAQLIVRGVAVDWTPCLTGGPLVDLPTYAFQHQRYWPDAAGSRGRRTPTATPRSGPPSNGRTSPPSPRPWADDSAALAPAAAGPGRLARATAPAGPLGRYRHRLGPAAVGRRHRRPGPG